jgi:hypothetical protein
MATCEEARLRRPFLEHGLTTRGTEGVPAMNRRFEAEAVRANGCACTAASAFCLLPSACFLLPLGAPPLFDGIAPEEMLLGG